MPAIKFLPILAGLALTTLALAPLAVLTDAALKRLPGGGSGPRLVGYFPGWRADAYPVSAVPADRFTHLSYAFVTLSAQGECTSDDPATDQANFAALQQLKRQHPHLKTLVSIGGGKFSTDFPDRFPDAARTPEARQRFARSCVQFMRQNGFDGIDIDWEYPRAADKQTFTAMLAELRSQLDAQARSDHRPYLLTFAAPAGAQNYAHLELDRISASLDWINLMTYDFAGSWSKVSNFNAPLYGSSDNPAPRAYNVDATVRAYLAAGVPAGKVVLGVRFPAAGWEGVADVNHGLFQPVGGPAQGTGQTHPPYSGTFSYSDLKAHYLNPGSGYTRYWHDAAQVPWLYNPTTGIMISYEDPQSLSLKADYAVAHHLGGVMIWEVSRDDDASSLLNALHTHLYRSQGATPSTGQP